MKIFFSYFKTLLELMLSPGNAWEEISARRESGQIVASRLMLPMFVLASASSLFDLVYHSYLVDLSDVILRAVATFVSYALSFFLSTIFFRAFLGKLVDGEPNEKKTSVVIAYCLALLALTTVICNLFPVSLGLQYLFPVLIGLVAWKANIYLCVRKEMEVAYAIFALLALALLPVLLMAAFDYMLNAI